MIRSNKVGIQTFAFLKIFARSNGPILASLKLAIRELKVQRMGHPAFQLKKRFSLNVVNAFFKVILGLKKSCVQKRDVTWCNFFKDKTEIC